MIKASGSVGAGSVRGSNGVVARPAERPHLAPAKAIPAAVPAPRKVLVVDDSGTAILRLRKIVEETGQYEVVGQALNGAEAVRLYKALQPDVVLMDILMPVMSGLQALKVILDHDPEAKVIMVSTIGAMGTAAIQALRLGARAVLAKPCESEEVLRSLGKLS
ncbi:MAG: response regulator [Nitrospirae bacterium]|nr:response regulator [Nitrospirota bacterium]